MVKLPESLEEKNLIRLMEIGETRYIVPWAMQVTKSRNCWLDGTCPTSEHPVGTEQLVVCNTEQGFVVDVRNCSWYTWILRDLTGNNWIVVSKLIGVKDE